MNLNLNKKTMTYIALGVGILVIYLAVKPASRDVTIYTTDT